MFGDGRVPLVRRSIFPNIIGVNGPYSLVRIDQLANNSPWNQQIVLETFGRLKIFVLIAQLYFYLNLAFSILKSNSILR